jgi:diguanylate cyclase (GGDEF)-like protein
MTDPLTGALNSRAFYEAAQTEIERARRYKHSLTIAYLDVDNFKIINDTSGHKEGDNLLRTMVEVMKSRVRRMDIVARLGGDEFAILMPETDQTSAMSVVQQTLKSLADETRKHNWPVTFSTGVLTIPEAFSTVNKMIEVADALMYEAKHGGKNRIRQATFGENQ